MTKLISAPLIQTLKPRSKPKDIRDSRVKGFILRVQPSGVMTYYVEYGRGKRKKIGPEAAFKPDEARTEARKVLAAFHKGEDPKANKLSYPYDGWFSPNGDHSKVRVDRHKIV